MANVNNITILGNLTRDVELRETPSGKKVTQVSLACNRSFRRGDEWEEETTFVDVTVWGNLAENLAASAGKGTEILVVGRLGQEHWENKEDGSPRSKHAIVADNVAVSLQWATAEVTKVKKGGSSSAPKRPQAQPEYDEEPF